VSWVARCRRLNWIPLEITRKVFGENLQSFRESFRRKLFRCMLVSYIRADVLSSEVIKKNTNTSKKIQNPKVLQKVFDFQRKAPSIKTLRKNVICFSIQLYGRTRAPGYKQRVPLALIERMKPTSNEVFVLVVLLVVHLNHGQGDEEMAVLSIAWPRPQT
jgi:hypothetical protein